MRRFVFREETVPKLVRLCFSFHFWSLLRSTQQLQMLEELPVHHNTFTTIRDGRLRVAETSPICAGLRSCEQLRPVDLSGQTTASRISMAQETHSSFVNQHSASTTVATTPRELCSFQSLDCLHSGASLLTRGARPIFSSATVSQSIINESALVNGTTKNTWKGTIPRHSREIACDSASKDQTQLASGGGKQHILNAIEWNTRASSVTQQEQAKHHLQESSTCSAEQHSSFLTVHVHLTDEFVCDNRPNIDFGDHFRTKSLANPGNSAFITVKL